MTKPCPGGGGKAVHQKISRLLGFVENDEIGGVVGKDVRSVCNITEHGPCNLAQDFGTSIAETPKNFNKDVNARKYFTNGRHGLK
jgi:hypothetical protein